MKCLTLTLLLFVTTTYSHFIVFENIGQMASAVTYLQVKLTVPIGKTEKVLYEYKNYVEKLYKQFVDIQKNPEINAGMHGEAKALAKQCEEMVYTYMMDSRNLRDEFGLVKWLLPTENRHERFIVALALAIGTMGTFMGLYSVAQINQLKTTLEETQFAQDKIIQAIINTDDEQNKIKESITFLDRLTTDWKNLNAGLYGARLNRMEKVVHRLITKTTNTFQMAQNHRLAIDFLEADELKEIYQLIIKKAADLKLTLLTTKPLDLFQLEISYFSDGTDLFLMLHVPAVASDSLLKLFKMHPFPLPISTNVALIPKVEHNIIGLTHGHNKLAAHLSSTDLLDCKTINKIFLCERHAVLHRHINASCMGALYLQNAASAAQLCPLTTTPLEEIVYQLAENWFLIYSPQPQTAQISCTNGTESQFYLSEGISKRHLSPGCRADFINNVLLTDSSVTVENTVQHFDWSWMADFTQFDNITEHLMEMHELGISTPTINELSHFTSHRNRGFNYYWHVSTVIISIVLLSLITTLALLCCTNRIVLRQCLGCMLFSKDNPLNETIELKDRNNLDDEIDHLANLQF